MKTFVICFVAIFAVVAGRSVIDNVDGEERNLDDGIDNRIFGGKPTTIEKHPHTIGVRHINYKNVEGGGAILSPIRALTVASYKLIGADASNYFILAGSKWESGHDDPRRQERNVSRFLIHEQYDGGNYAINNIAILFWEKPLTFGANVRAISLPEANDPLPFGQNVTVTGFGLNGMGNHNLHVVSFPVVSNEVCHRKWEGNIQPEQFCAGIDGERRGASYGDRGDPMVHNKKLIGVLSRSYVGTDVDIYTNVALYNDWIESNSE